MMFPETLDPQVAWLSAGVILCIAEMLVPGVFLMWLGIAALLTGMAVWILPIGVAFQLALFAILAMASIFLGRRWTGSDNIASDDPLLNDRLGRLVGETVVVTEAIAQGSGRVRVGDGEWNARGPDAAVGQHMRVAGSQAGALIVEPI